MKNKKNTFRKNKIIYEPEDDVLNIWLSDKEYEYGKDNGDLVITHYTKDGEPVYIEILFASRFFKNAGSDFIIIPSHYEPCGLIQMVAMKYGTIPLASETGGLKDSIASGKNGILFKKNSVSSLIKALKEALLIYNNPNKLKSILVSAMKTDFSWDKSAILYRKLYERLLRENNV